MVFIGVGLAARGLFSEGSDYQDAVLAQRDRRTTALDMEPFAVNSDHGRRQWRQLLLAVEQRVVLAENYPGMIADDLCDYLYARSTGHIGSLMTLINRGCQRAPDKCLIGRFQWSKSGDGSGPQDKPGRGSRETGSKRGVREAHRLIDYRHSRRLVQDSIDGTPTKAARSRAPRRTPDQREVWWCGYFRIVERVDTRITCSRKSVRLAYWGWYSDSSHEPQAWLSLWSAAKVVPPFRVIAVFLNHRDGSTGRTEGRCEDGRRVRQIGTTSDGAAGAAR